MPAGEAVLIIPADNTPLGRVLRQVAPQLRARGRHITFLPTE